MPTPEAIRQELMRDALLYPARKGAESIEQAAVVWAEALGAMSNDAYVRAHIEARKACTFPPTPADVIAAYRDQGARPQADYKALPRNPMTRTEVSRQHIANICAMSHDEPMPYADLALRANPEVFERYHARIDRTRARVV